jgi:hypothetical protein
MNAIYQKDGLIVRDMHPDDVQYIADHMRPSDIQEIWAVGHRTPIESLIRAITISNRVYTAEWNGVPTAIFGTAETNDPEVASIWMLGTDCVQNIWFRSIVASREVLPELVIGYRRLFNMVDARNTRSIKWLEWLGANIHEPKPYGVDGLPFRYFEFTGRN